MRLLEIRQASCVSCKTHQLFSSQRAHFLIWKSFVPANMDDTTSKKRGRTNVKGTTQAPSQFQRIAVTHGHKLDVVETYAADGMQAAIDKHYSGLEGKKQIANKKRLIRKWFQDRDELSRLCKQGGKRRKRVRKPGLGTVLSPQVEEQIVFWINDLRKDGVPVSVTMLQLSARDFAMDAGVSSETFAASRSWVKCFLRRHRLSLRMRTRAGQDTPENAAAKAIEFAAKLQKIVQEHNVSEIYNADQTGAVTMEQPTSETDMY